MTKYPTKEEILAEDMEFTPRVLAIMAELKSKWQEIKNNSDELKFQLLYMYIHSLLPKENPLCIIRGNTYCYNSETKTIMFGKKPSIISALHELGHHLYGHSELLACRYSVHLFKQTFPKAYAKLKWDGHMLKKN